MKENVPLAAPEKKVIKSPKLETALLLLSKIRVLILPKI
jgi:hypothetical protein